MPYDPSVQQILSRIDGKGYGAYQDLRGTYRSPKLTVTVEHVQKDPYAPPSRIRLTGPRDIPAAFTATPPRRVAAEDYVARAMAAAIGRASARHGSIRIDAGGQEMLRRSAVTLYPDTWEVRLAVELPARGRTVLGRAALALFEDIFPALAADACRFAPIAEGLARWTAMADDQSYLRDFLAERDLVAFVADGAILPRESGQSVRPLLTALPFASPDTLAVTADLPHAGPVRGMGIPKGVTLIVGGGYHGKSTLLRAIELGVYNHIPGDGRELVITRADACKIRTEDGRRIEAVDLSPFLHDLPGGSPVNRFRTDAASGSTSQAASLLEALEMGAHVLLFDEDRSAANFLVRDHLMQQLIEREREPITPLLDRIRSLWEDRGVSTILALGGSGEYLAAADVVIAMDNYRAEDVTARARTIVSHSPVHRHQEFPGPFPAVTPRRVSRMPAAGRIALKGDALVFGNESVSLSHLDQLVDPSQSRAIAALLSRVGETPVAGAPLPDLLKQVLARLADAGFGWLGTGDYAEPRLYELAAVLNRLGGFRAES